MTEMHWLTADQLARSYRAGELSPVEVVEAVLARVDAGDSEINSMVTVTAELARGQAKAAEQRFRLGEQLPPLFGVPITVKDLVDTAAVRTTYGCVAYADHVPDRDALAWERLKSAGAILIGKSTTPEFGLLGITQSHLTGVTYNPWRPGYSAGGSSGGTAASVAAGMATLGWGSDGGGSIRVPASLCGIVGLKPSVGRIPHLNNTDADGTEGPMTRSVLDAALMLDATAGRHPRDRFTVPTGDDAFVESARRDGDLTGWRIAATTLDEQGPVAPEVRKAFEGALETLRGLGATVDIVSLQFPDPHSFFITYWGPEFATAVQEMQETGLEIWPSILYFAEQAKDLAPLQVSTAMRETKTAIYNTYADCFDSYDILVTPTTPTTAFPHNGDVGGVEVIDGVAVDHPNISLHRFTEAPSHAGVPAITVPCGRTTTGLPVGMQLVAPMYEDARLLYAAARYEQATPWHAMHPTVHKTDSVNTLNAN